MLMIHIFTFSHYASPHSTLIFTTPLISPPLHSTNFFTTPFFTTPLISPPLHSTHFFTTPFFTSPHHYTLFSTIRERWHNHLNPDINKSPWSEEEDRTILSTHSAMGNRWAELAKFLPGKYLCVYVLIVYMCCTCTVPDTHSFFFIFSTVDGSVLLIWERIKN